MCFMEVFSQHVCAIVFFTSPLQSKIPDIYKDINNTLARGLDDQAKEIAVAVYLIMELSLRVDKKKR